MIRTVALLLLTPALALADFAEDFQKTRGTKDHAAMVKLLEAAAKTEAENPDYYALASNYSFPDHPYAYNLLAALADAKGDKDGAYRFLKLAGEKAPEDTLVLSNLADAHRARGKKADAIAVYEKIIKLEPEGQAAAAAKEALEEVGEEKK